ncbi:CBS domain-containing protein [soil metagenome]
MKVKDIMSTKPHYISPQTTLQEAAIKMSEWGLGSLPIGENDKLIGMLTDRDITIRGVAKGKNPSTTPVKDVMTMKVLYCYENDDVNKVSDSMCGEKIRRLIVLNDNKRFTGFISLGDIAAKTHDHDLTGHILEIVAGAVKKAA